jgi:hypothetical protein
LQQCPVVSVDEENYQALVPLASVTPGTNIAFYDWLKGIVGLRC